MITWHTGQGGEHLAQVKTHYPDSKRKFQLGMHEATLPEFYSVCLSYAPVPVCKDTLPWCCAGTADDQTPWSSDLELHNELKIYAANQRDKNLIRTSRTIRMRHDIDRQRSPFFHQSLRKGQPLAIEKVKSCKLTVQRRRDWDEERGKRAILFLSLSLRLVLRPHTSRLRRSPLIRVVELPWLKRTHFLWEIVMFMDLLHHWFIFLP